MWLIELSVARKLQEESPCVFSKCYLAGHNSIFPFATQGVRWANTVLVLSRHYNSTFFVVEPFLHSIRRINGPNCSPMAAFITNIRYNKTLFAASATSLEKGSTVILKDNMWFKWDERRSSVRTTWKSDVTIHSLAIPPVPQSRLHLMLWSSTVKPPSRMLIATNSHMICHSSLLTITSQISPPK